MQACAEIHTSHNQTGAEKHCKNKKQPHNLQSCGNFKTAKPTQREKTEQGADDVLSN
jgi:hypothetical protein